MKNFLISATVGIGLACSAATFAAAGSDQRPLVLAQGFGVEVGPNGVGVGVGRDRDDDRYREERREERRDEERSDYRRGDEGCRVVTERRTNDEGEVVVRRRRDCD